MTIQYLIKNLLTLTPILAQISMKTGIVILKADILPLHYYHQSIGIALPEEWYFEQLVEPSPGLTESKILEKIKLRKHKSDTCQR